jgi:flagellar motor switch protein FliM
LLTQVEQVTPAAGAEMPTAVLPAGRDHTRRHQFPSLTPLSQADLRPLRMRHEDIIASLSARLSIHLGLQVDLQMSKLEPSTFQKFTEALSNPTFLTLLKMQPLDGTCLLDIAPRLALTMVDRELGGPGKALEEAPQIGKTEAKLLSTVVGLIAAEWCFNWADIMEIRPFIIGSELNSRFVRTSEPDTTMLVVGMEARIGDLSEQIQFAFPHTMLEPLTLKLNSGTATDDKAGATAKPAAPKWNPLYDDIRLEVRAELPELHVPASQISELKLGDIIDLPPECMNQVRLRLANHPGFIGSLGSTNKYRAIKIEKCPKR